MAEEEGGPKFNKANIDDEFLRHPHSGAFIRNPLLDADPSAPILFQSGEFEFNCLEEAMPEYRCIKVSESAFKELVAGKAEMTLERPEQSPPKTPSRSTLQRAALGRLSDLPAGYEFVVTLQKSTYVQPRQTRRRQAEARSSAGTAVEKLNIELSDLGGKALRVENITEGLIAAWNRTNPAFAVRQGDCVVKVNMIQKSAAGMLEELQTSPEHLRVTVRRAPPDQRESSKARMTAEE